MSALREGRWRGSRHAARARPNNVRVRTNHPPEGCLLVRRLSRRIGNQVLQLTAHPLRRHTEARAARARKVVCCPSFFRLLCRSLLPRRTCLVHPCPTLPFPSLILHCYSCPQSFLPPESACMEAKSPSSFSLLLILLSTCLTRPQIEWCF